MCLLVLCHHPQVPLSKTSLLSFSLQVLLSLSPKCIPHSHLQCSQTILVSYWSYGVVCPLRSTLTSQRSILMQQLEASFYNRSAHVSSLPQTLQWFHFSLDQHPVVFVGFCTYHGLVLPLRALLFCSHITPRGTNLLAFP